MKGHKYCKLSSILAQKQCVKIPMSDQKECVEDKVYEFIKGER